MAVHYDLKSEFVTARNVPAITVSRLQEKENAPRVVMLHGLHSRKEKYLEELYLLARMGLRATAVDLALHGEHQDIFESENPFTVDFLGAMQRVIYDTAKDVIGLLDSWDPEPGSVGILGVSAGGLAAHAIAVQDARIGAIAAVCSSPDWTTADPRFRPQPGSPVEQMLSSLSPVNNPAAYIPKAVLMLNGDLDEIISSSGSKLLFDRLEPLYERSAMRDRLMLKNYPELGHSYTSEMRDISLEWLRKHLTEK